MHSCRCHYSGEPKENFTVRFYEDHAELLEIFPSVIQVPAKFNNNTWTQQLCILGQKPGHVEVLGNSTPVGVADDSNLIFKILVANSRSIILISFIVGWIYFAAWSISFYPQIWINFKRKSVVGLNFDFLALNLLGHSLYMIFNVSLYWIPFMEQEYFRRFPRGLNPVELNDVVFSLHATTITALTIVQCFFYEVWSIIY